MNNDHHLPPSEAGRSESDTSLAQAARCLHKTSRLSPTGFTPETEALARQLQDSFDAGTDTEMMLYTQACILDQMFKHYMTDVIHYEQTHWQTGVTTQHISRDGLAVALRLQQHARTTLRALSLNRKKKERDNNEK